MLRISRLAATKQVFCRSVVTSVDSKLFEHALARLQDSYTHSTLGNASQSIQDLRTLHEQGCIIPKHFLAHAYSQAASSTKEDGLFEDITQLAILNHPRTNPPPPTKESSRLKDIITIGIKQAIFRDQYAQAYNIWSTAKEAKLFTHTDNQDLIKHVYGSKVHPQDKKRIGRATQPLQSSQDVNKLQTQYIELTSLLRSSSAIHSSLLPKAKELIENILHATPTNTHRQPLSPEMLRGLREHVVSLVQQQDLNEALQLLSSYLLKAGYGKEEMGLKDMESDKGMDMVLALLPHNPPRPVPIFTHPAFHPTSPSQWVYDTLLAAIKKGGKESTSFANSNPSAAATVSQVIDGKVEILGRVAQFLQSFGIAADARLVGVGLEAMVVSMERQGLGIDKGAEGVLSLPSIRPIIGYLERGGGGAGGGVWEGLVRLLRGSGTRKEMARLLEIWGKVLSNSSLPPPPLSALNLMCAAGRDGAHTRPLRNIYKSLSSLSNPHASRTVTSPSSHPSVCPASALLQSRLQVLHALASPLDMLALLRASWLRGQPLSRRALVLTVDALVNFPSSSADRSRYWAEVAGVADWLHSLGTSSGLLGKDEGLALVLPMFLPPLAAELAGIRKEEREAGAELVGKRKAEVVLNAMKKTIVKHWSKPLPPFSSPPIPTPDPWTSHDESVLNLYLTALCELEQREEALEALLALNGLYPPTQGKWGALSPQTLLPIVQSHVEKGQVDVGRRLV
eukprot:gene34191-41389_t